MGSRSRCGQDLDVAARGAGLGARGGADDRREGGTRLEMDWEIEAKIPLLGGKIEKLAADEVRARMAKDAALSNELVGRFGER